MENNQLINNFDAMLKQSLEESQMPVPTGVWEAVGSSIGTKAIVAAKAASLKLLILKAVAGVVLAGGLGFGAYELLKPQPIKPITNDTVTDNTNGETGINLDTIYPSQISPESQKLSSKSPLNENLISEIIKPELVSIADKNEISQETNTPDNDAPKIIEPAKQVEIPKQVENNISSEPQIKEPEKGAADSNEIISTNNIILPNVFTPNDKDGVNDYFKIIIENETKFILQVFDERGNKVFESTDKNKGWDGRNMNTGEMCRVGLYTYKLVYELRNGYKKTEYNGLNLY